MEKEPKSLPGPEGQIEQPNEFDWQAFDRLAEELHGVFLAYGSYHRSAQNMEMYGWDEHGVYPGEEDILNRVLAEIREKIAELGEPPACVECKGSGEVYRFSENQFGERIYDEHLTGCWCCGGTGEYQKPKDQEDVEPAPDEHLESDYEDRFGGGDDDVPF